MGLGDEVNHNCLIEIHTSAFSSYFFINNWIIIGTKSLLIGVFQFSIGKMQFSIGKMQFNIGTI